MAFFAPHAPPFGQPQLINQNQHLQMPTLLHSQPKPFSPLVLPTPQQQSILGAPPGGRGMPMSPFLNAAVFNRGTVPVRPAIRPHITTYKKPVVAPTASSPTIPVNNGEVLSKLAKLIPEFSNPEKSTVNAKTFNDLLTRGLNKQTAPNFYAALETLAVHIGKEEFNQKALWRVFEYAFLNKYLFSANPTHLENIIKWKKEADALMNPGAPQEGRKRDLAEAPTTTATATAATTATAAAAATTTQSNAATPSAAKRARTTANFSQKTYNVVDVGQQVEVLQEELVAVKEELKTLRDQHKREIDLLYQHLGLAPPAPLTPEQDPELYAEHASEPAAHEQPTQAEHAESAEGTEHAESAVENAEQVVVDGGEGKVGEVEMAEGTNGTETNV